MAKKKAVKVEVFVPTKVPELPSVQGVELSETPIIEETQATAPPPEILREYVCVICDTDYTKNRVKPERGCPECGSVNYKRKG